MAKIGSESEYKAKFKSSTVFHSIFNEFNTNGEHSYTFVNQPLLPHWLFSELLLLIVDFQ